MKKIYLLPIIIVIILIIIFRKKGPEITDIKYFNFGYSTGNMMYAYVSYNINLEKNKYIVSIKPTGIPEEKTLKKEINVEEVKKVEEILKKYEVGKWDGFNKSDKNVLDGNSFSLYTRFTNDDTIDAHGYMKYPKNYKEVREELDKFFMDIYNEKIN